MGDRSEGRVGQTWWATTDGDPCPECSDSVVLTNGKEARCKHCDWRGDYEELDR